MDVSVEDKLRLVQKLREDAGMNETAIRTRRQILSGYERYDETMSYVGQGSFLSLKLRLFFSAVLFFAFLLMQFGGYQMGTLQSEDIIAAVSEESDWNGFPWFSTAEE